MEHCKRFKIKTKIPVWTVLKKAEETIKEKGKPMSTFEVQAMDIPWIVLGDKVKCEAGDALGEFIVTGISHSINDNEKIMQLSL